MYIWGIYFRKQDYRWGVFAPLSFGPDARKALTLKFEGNVNQA